MTCFMSRALIREEKNKVAQNRKKREKSNLSYLDIYINYSKFLKHFARTFCQAQTLKFGGVTV